VDEFSIIKEAVISSHPPGSQEALLMHIYQELPLRSDFGDIKIVPTRKDINEPEHKLPDGQFDQNYLILPPKGRAEVVINMYKTASRYGPIDEKMSAKLSDMLRKSVKDKPRKYLFIKDSVFNALKPDSYRAGSAALYKDGDMSAFLSRALEIASKYCEQIDPKTGKRRCEFTKSTREQIAESGRAHNAGAFNLLRHSYVSEQFRKNKMSAAERTKLAAAMRHSPMVQIAYIREKGIDKLSEAEMKSVERA